MKVSRLGLALSLIVAAVAAALMLDLSPWLRGGYGWRWGYDPGLPLGALGIGLLLAAYVGVGAWLLQRTRRAAPSLLLAVLASLLLTLLTTHTQTGDAVYALNARTASGLTTGPHWAAAQIDWGGGEWQDWTAVMARLGGHLGTSPPGLPMLYGLLNHGLSAAPGLVDSLAEPLQITWCHDYALHPYTPAQWASIWTGVLLPLLAALTVLPIFALARRLRPQADARLVALWWPLVPGIASFGASWSTVYPLLSAAAFLPLLVALEAESRRGRWGGALAAGLLSGIATFIHFAFLPILGLFGLYTLGTWWVRRSAAARPPHRIGWAINIGLAFGLGLLLPWAVFWLAGGDDPLSILRASLDYHLDLDRPYWFWVWFHVWDFALWAGLGLMLLAAAGLWHALRQRDAQPPPLLTVALFLTLLIMTTSATTRGESGRIWLFLAPFLLLAAFDGLYRLRPEPAARRADWLALTAAHALLALALTANLSVIGHDMTRPPQPQDIANPSAVPLAATFSTGQPPQAQFALVDWQAMPDGSAVTLTLTWRGIQRADAPYWFGAFLVGPDGTQTEPILWQPRESLGRAERYPTTCWAADTMLRDTVRLPLPADPVPGDWGISLAVFGDPTGPEGRLRVTGPDGTTDVQVSLWPVPLD